jgi:Outer membrane protein beta-barrel domain
MVYEHFRLLPPQKEMFMKKTLFIAVMLFAAKGILAQHTTQFGVKGGVNFANLKIQNASEGDHRVGLHLGALAHIHISRRFALQPEIMYSAQGREQSINNIDYTTRLSYINVPVLAQYMAGSGFRLQTGPQVGFLVDAESATGNVEIDVSDNYEKVDVSWAFGASYLTTSRIGFDARYNLGLTNINDGNQEIKNRVWQLGLFYQFKPRRR